jgi:hypothetical protein
MKGVFQLADLTVQLEGSLQELVRAQSVQREFDRACRKLRLASGSDEVHIRIDDNLQSDDGHEFSKIRLRAYSGEEEVYTIDVGSTEDNLFEAYVDYDAPVQLYNRETGEETELYPLQETDAQEGASQESEPVQGADQPPSERTGYDPKAPPNCPTDENGRITKKGALALWDVAQEAGHTKKSFAHMLADTAGVKKPQLLHSGDWQQVWEYACDPATWKIEQEIEEERELPIE